jgi:hypothetical protein
MTVPVDLAQMGITLRALPAAPPQREDGRIYGIWSRIAADLATYPDGTWVAIGGVPPAALTSPYGASSLVVACRRQGFRIAIRSTPDGLYVLRGRTIDAGFARRDV